IHCLREWHAHDHCPSDVSHVPAKAYVQTKHNSMKLFCSFVRIKCPDTNTAPSSRQGFSLCIFVSFVVEAFRVSPTHPIPSCYNHPSPRANPNCCYGLRPARNFSRSCAAELLLPRRRKALPHSARNLIADSISRRRSWREVVRPLRRQSLSHSLGQAFSEICRTNGGIPQGHANRHRRNRTRSPGRDRRRRQRRHLPPHFA